MADIALTAAEIKVVFPSRAETYDFVAAVAVTKGQLVYLNTSGLVALADANAAGAQQAIGIALTKAAAGEAVTVLKQGHIAGFTITQNYGVPLYLSDTAGAMADAAGTMTVPVGRVVGLSDKPNYTKVFYADFAWGTQYS